ncbi:hypothetical protein CHESTER_116 [Vibrio phage Chester]|uniref:Uncharacterized protein n=1 Tax=Vibrio phage Chester TaxID=2712961 RepID=A0A6G8R5U8_9CAUD|nr:hypothetical protein KNU88_gp185 [Vibrio phage Chester]QIN96528.1 hypothetical protein CHESTER_116 [Vibrio phage Chester]
MAAKRIPNPPT